MLFKSNQRSLMYFSGTSAQTKKHSLKRSAPAPPSGKDQETERAERTHSGESSPLSPDIPNGFCSPTVLPVEKADCASSPIHIPRSPVSGGEQVNQSAINKMDCATSPIKSPTVHREKSSESQSEVVNIASIPLPPGLGPGLIEEVRRNTGLSYEKSGVAVETVLGHLGLKIPEIFPVLDKVCLTLHEVCSVYRNS